MMGIKVIYRLSYLLCMKFSFCLAFFQATKEAIETLVAFYKSAARKASNHDKAAAVLVQSAEAGGVGMGDGHAKIYGRHIWLVVWNIFISPYIGNNHPN